MFAVRVLAGARFPDLLNEPVDEVIEDSLVLPDAALGDAPAAVRV